MNKKTCLLLLVLLLQTFSAYSGFKDIPRRPIKRYGETTYLTVWEPPLGRWQCYNSTDIVDLVVRRARFRHSQQLPSHIIAGWTNMRSLKINSLYTLKLYSDFFKKYMASDLCWNCASDFIRFDDNRSRIHRHVTQAKIRRLCSLPKLERLELKDNHLHRIPPEIQNMKDHLKTLVLSGNKISRRRRNQLHEWLPQTEIIF